MSLLLRFGSEEDQMENEQILEELDKEYLIARADEAFEEDFDASNCIIGRDNE